MNLVLEMPVESLRTTLAPLRGERTDRHSTLSPMPLRVAAADDGAFEVLDGFKRLAQWRCEGRRQVPVVLEPVSGVARKARVLEANCPQKTLSPMDAARVVASLAEEDGLSSAAISKLLERKKTWVERRLTLSRRLCPELGRRLDTGQLGVSVALSLSSFAPSEQKRLADSIRRHALRTPEAEAFVATYRAASEGVTREALLRDPLCAQPQPRDQDASPLGSTAAEIERRFDATEEALEELVGADFTGFADVGRRVLEARQRRLLARIRQLATPTKEEPHETRRTQGDPRSPPARVEDQGHRPQALPRPQDDPQGPRAGSQECVSLQARGLQAPDPGTRRQGLQGPQDPPRHPRAGLHRGDDHPQGVPQGDPRRTEEASQGLSALRPHYRWGHFDALPVVLSGRK